MKSSDATADSRMREIARLDITGLSAGQIAERLGLNSNHVSRVRQKPAYRAIVSALHEAADRDAIALARRTRDNALRAITLGLAQIGRHLQQPDLGPNDAARLTGAALDIYRATSAQTGLAETTHIEVAPGESAFRRVLAEMASMTDEEFAASEGAIIDVGEE
jgi:hypothetical protein